MPSSGSTGPNPYGQRGEPVNIASGNYFYQATDLRLPTGSPDLPLDVVRTHNSNVVADGGDASETQWTFSLEPMLSVRQSDGYVEKVYSDGVVAGWVPQPDGSYKTDNPRVSDALVKNPDGSFTLATPHGIQETWVDSGLIEFTGGYTWTDYRITARKDRNGNSITWQYDSNWNLTGVVDPAGRLLQVQMDPSNPNLIASIIDWAGRKVTYNYSSYLNFRASLP